MRYLAVALLCFYALGAVAADPIEMTYKRVAGRDLKAYVFMPSGHIESAEAPVVIFFMAVGGGGVLLNRDSVTVSFWWNGELCLSLLSIVLLRILCRQPLMKSSAMRNLPCVGPVSKPQC